MCWFLFFLDSVHKVCTSRVLDLWIISNAIQKFKKLNDSVCTPCICCAICVERFAFGNSNIFCQVTELSTAVRVRSCGGLMPNNHIPFWISIKSWWIAKLWCMHILASAVWLMPSFRRRSQLSNCLYKYNCCYYNGLILNHTAPVREANIFD